MDQDEVNGFVSADGQTPDGQSVLSNETPLSEGQEETAQEPEKSSEETQETEEEVVIPEKFRGQSQDETLKKITKSYTELEKKIGQTTQETAYYKRLNEQLENSLKFLQQQQTAPKTPPQNENPNKLLDELIKNPKQAISRWTQDLIAPIYKQQIQQKWEQQRMLVREKIGETVHNQLDSEIIATMSRRPEYLSDPDGYLRATTEVLGRAYLGGIKQKPTASFVEAPKPLPKTTKNITSTAQKVADLYGKKAEKVQEEMEKIVNGEFMPIGED